MKFSQPLLVAVFGLTCTVSTAPTAQVETSIVKRMAPWSATDKAAILAVVNKFDAAYGIPKKNWSASLYSDTVLCGQADNGVNENHCGPVSPFTGSWAQVIAPGQGIHDKVGPSLKPYSPFEAAYYEWLCEVPGDSQLGAKCPQIASLTGVGTSAGVTGHHDILTSATYTQIGCNFTHAPTYSGKDQWHGLWICNLSA